MSAKSGFDYFCDAMKRWTEFNGRARRKEFWYFILFNVLITFVAEIVFLILAGEDGQTAASFIASVVFFIPALAVGVRRLHDTNRSGWWCLLIFVPLAGWIVLLVFHVQDSDRETNVFGLNPKLVDGDVEAEPKPEPFKQSPPADDMSKFDNIERLAKMRDQGILTEEEFQEQKKKYL